MVTLNFSALNKYSFALLEYNLDQNMIVHIHETDINLHVFKLVVLENMLTERPNLNNVERGHFQDTIHIKFHKNPNVGSSNEVGKTFFFRQLTQ